MALTLAQQALEVHMDLFVPNVAERLIQDGPSWGVAEVASCAVSVASLLVAPLRQGAAAESSLVAAGHSAG